jgi:hypothetical protein
MRTLDLLKKRENLFLLFILVAAFILRFFRLGYESFWLDELHTMIDTGPTVSFSNFYIIWQLPISIRPFSFLSSGLSSAFSADRKSPPGFFPLDRCGQRVDDVPVRKGNTEQEPGADRRRFYLRQLLQFILFP